MSGADGRPRLHLTPRSGWINDTYGLTWHDGRYHVFFQHVPGSTTWDAAQHWGHAVSDDLLRWDERPVALEPDDRDGGVWSGSVVEGRAFYTSVALDDVDHATVRVAHADDTSWQTWSKGETVALGPGDPAGDLDLRAVRDPFVLRDDTGGRPVWRMVVGGGLHDGTAVALTHTSEDLETWTYQGVLASRHTDDTEDDVGSTDWTGSVWECPQLFRLRPPPEEGETPGDRGHPTQDDEWVLVVSVCDGETTSWEACALGTLRDGVLHTRGWHRLTWGPGLYAGSTYVDAEGRRGMVHWIRGVLDPGGRWAGAQSLPHLVRLHEGRVVLDPHPAVTAARTGHPVEMAGTLTHLGGPVDLEVAGPITLRIGDCAMRITEELLLVDNAGERWVVPVPGDALRIVVDGPVVEVFGLMGASAWGLSAPAASIEVSGPGSAQGWALS